MQIEDSILSNVLQDESFNSKLSSTTIDKDAELLTCANVFQNRMYGFH